MHRMGIYIGLSFDRHVEVQCENESEDNIPEVSICIS